MAEADWTVTRGSTGAVLNSSLANPLPESVGSGFCRLFSASSPYNGSTLRSNRPEFTNIPETKALSASMCMRRAAGFSNGAFAGFRLKGTSVQFDTSGSGYGIVMESGASGVPILKVNNTDTLSLDGLPVSSFYDNNWIRLRLDVFPIGSAADQLFVYRETVIGSGVWDQVGIAGGLPSAGLLITSSSPRYAPWNTGDVYIECTNFSGNTYYFDTFTMSVTDV